MKRKASSLSLIVSILFLIVTFICTTYTFSYAEKSFLWRVQSKRSTVYILGSIHLLKKDIYPLSRTIENAFEKSDYLAVEADINEIGRLNIQKLMESAFYSGNDALRNTFPEVPSTLLKSKQKGLVCPLSLSITRSRGSWD